MKQNRKPLKPDRPVTSIVFPKKGKVSLAAEHLPRTQDELELAIGKKFIGALAHFYGPKLSDLKSGSGRGDLVCNDEQGSVTKIQVVEVIDHKLRRLSEMRQTYAEYIRREYPAVLNKYRGCAVTLVDNGEPPYLPKIKTKDGKQSADHLAAWLADIGDKIYTLECKKNRIHSSTVGPSERGVTAFIQRFAAAGEDGRFSFRWSGGGPSYRSDEPRNVLPAAIKGKIEKHYSKPNEQFWLLCYSTDTLLREDDPDIRESFTLLDNGNHPFDEVWYIYPYNGVDLGHIVHVWPRQQPS